MLKKPRKLGKTMDIRLRWVIGLNPELEQWRTLAEEWLKETKRDKPLAMKALSKFLGDYIFKYNLSTDPVEFLSRGYTTPSFYSSCLSNLSSKLAKAHLSHISNFLDWVLINYHSVKEDNGNKYIMSEFHNPISIELSLVGNVGSSLSESNKNILPYKLIKQLRIMLCPKDASNFTHWDWARKSFKGVAKNADWFVVESSAIDKNDPDCVWRMRNSSKREYELWSPVRAVALYTKLLIPLRAYQIRMLDSGESDTLRYEQANRYEVGQWIRNEGLLNKGTEKHPVALGVFRRFTDTLTRVEMTGFYINTNKTADIYKEESAKGYEIPWQYEEALYWLSKLRDWQEKYNPIESPTPWESLEKKHTGDIKDIDILKQMGKTCFLFRNPCGKGENRAKPISSTSLNPMWYNQLFELERQCNSNEDNNRLKFIKNKRTTYYPLHSLRVSLITAYALEGGVPMPILSKCIAGHSRLIMTLYYTKAGIAYVSEKMNEAELHLADKEQDVFERWLKESTYKELEAYCAINDPSSLQAVICAQQSGASFIKDDKGICPRGNFGCDSGGVYINDDTGKVSFGAVPGYPEQNCVRCRWFLTGPAFLSGLVHHFNVIGYNLGEVGERLKYFEGEIEQLENMKYKHEQNNQLFMKIDKLHKFEKLHQQEVQKNDKLANDYNSTFRLIARCINIIEDYDKDGKDQIISVGTINDVKLSLENVPDKLYQIQSVCKGAVIYPETDASKAILQRSQILDLALQINEFKPVFFSLSEEQQLIAGNAMISLLESRAGSFKASVPYIKGSKRLVEVELIPEMNDLLKMINEKRSTPNIVDNQSRTSIAQLSNKKGGELDGKYQPY